VRWEWPVVLFYVHTAYYFALSSFIQITNEIGTDFDQFFWHTSTILVYICLKTNALSKQLRFMLCGMCFVSWLRNQFHQTCSWHKWVARLKAQYSRSFFALIKELGSPCGACTVGFCLSTKWLVLWSLVLPPLFFVSFPHLY